MRPRKTSYPATVSGVRLGLKAIGCTQTEGARQTQQSEALVSMVLTKKARSQPCLDKLAAYINAQLARNGGPPRAR